LSAMVSDSRLLTEFRCAFDFYFHLNENHQHQQKNSQVFRLTVYQLMFFIWFNYLHLYHTK